MVSITMKGENNMDFLSEKDIAIVEEIAKLHKVDVKTVEKYYRELLKNIEKAANKQNERF